MKVTLIYELYAPYGRKAMYVGKGSKNRMKWHWQVFCRTGQAVNTKLRHWFKSLQARKLVPQFRIRETVKVSKWEERERYWIAYWRKRNPNLCNINQGGNAWPDSAGRAGNLAARKVLNTRFPKGSPFLVWAKDHPTKARHAWRKGGIRGGKATAVWMKRNPGKAFRNLSAAGRKGGLKGSLALIKRPNLGNHTRWHVTLRRRSAECKWCRKGVILGH